MTLDIGVSVSGVRVPVSRDRVAVIARHVLRSERVRHAMLSITFVSTRAMRALNLAHLRRRGDTDVISFGFRDAGRPQALIGDVYIAPDVARASAKTNDITVREEIVRLVVHGTLHTVGYDHPEGASRTRSVMWRKQENLVALLTPRHAR